MTLKELIDKLNNPLDVTLYDKDRNMICNCKSDSIAVTKFADWLVVDFFPHFIVFSEHASLEICIKENLPFE